MASKLKTGWKRTGRSGKTVDGRDIPREAIFEAAETYDPELFTALIWPDHLRYFNMGKVEQLRAEENDEGGVDLFAILAPNDIYQSINKAGQRLFTSMELLPDFRGTGKWYLTGLAATDNPASAATSEIRFSAIDNKTALMADFVENESHNFSQHDADGFTQLRDFFKSLIPSIEGDMDKKTAEQLTASMVALTQKVEVITTQFNQQPAASAAPTGDAPNGEALTLSQLGAKVEELETKVETFTAGGGDDTENDDATGIDAAQFAKLSTDLKTLQEQFTAALTAQPGTDAGEQGGGDTELSSCL